MPHGIDLSWKADYELGEKSVDDAHREIFRMTARLLESRGDRKAAEEAAWFLRDYVIRHFADEEELMRDVGFAGIAGHAAQHRKMRLETLPALEADLKASGYSRESVGRFAAALVGWLSDHVMVHDKAIGFLKYM